MAEEQRKYNTIKELDGAVQGIEQQLTTLTEMVQQVLNAQAAKPAAPAQVPGTPVGQMPRAQGNYNQRNEFDPTLQIEIFMVPAEGRIPKILTFPGDKDGPLQYAPRFDEQQRAHYYLPRRFGEAQLKNESGMKWGLCWPNELTIVMRGERMRKEQRVYRADPDCPPIMVTQDGVPIQETVTA